MALVLVLPAAATVSSVGKVSVAGAGCGPVLDTHTYHVDNPRIIGFVLKLTESKERKIVVEDRREKPY